MFGVSEAFITVDRFLLFDLQDPAVLGSFFPLWPSFEVPLLGLIFYPNIKHGSYSGLGHGLFFSDSE